MGRKAIRFGGRIGAANPVALLGYALSGPGKPYRRLVHLGLHIEDQDGRNGSDNKQATPADAMEEEGERSRSQDGPQRVAFLQDAGEGAAAFLGQRLKGQCRAYAPLAAHGNAEQCPQHQQDAERRRKGAGQFNHRETEDVEHQNRPAAIAVGQHSEQKRADRAEGLGHEDRAQHRRGLGVKLARNGLDAEDEQEEVETIERPAKKGGQKCVPLLTAQLAKIVYHGHRRENIRP